ncbi:methyltransferase domain-containing protein [Paenibacillus contaminans]|nr:methyltransferase domain-containing protein [Paenibacillus contaminans]
MAWGERMDNEMLEDSAISRFFIKPGYTSRAKPEYFEDRYEEGSFVIYQPDVYKLAEVLGERFGCRYIVDIGCGNGKKLAELYPKFAIVGIDYGRNLDTCRQEYPFGTWLEHNLDTDDIVIPDEILSQAILVCADVIEHLVDPSHLLRNLKRMMDLSPACLLSTPDRDLSTPSGHLGPPINTAHVREWNLAELSELLHHDQFHVEFIGLTMNNHYNLEKKTILSIIGNNRLNKNALEEIKVAAILTAYNEEDIIYHSINRLLEQHIHVYVIENWSTDSTYEILSQFRSNPYFIGCERFPYEGPVPYFNWSQLLARVTAISRTIYADWYIHHDTDEIRASPWPEMNVREAIAYVDRMGFNAIDHTVIEFFPIGNHLPTEANHEADLKYFEFGKQESDFQQIKIWKNTGQPVVLADGGHNAWFEGRRVCPYKFLTKHYPFRSQLQAEKKIFQDRKARLAPEERAAGMHIHYDEYDPGHLFVRNPSELELYQEYDFNTKYLVERLSGIRLPKTPYRAAASLAPVPQATIPPRPIRRKKPLSNRMPKAKPPLLIRKPKGKPIFQFRKPIGKKPIRRTQAAIVNKYPKKRVMHNRPAKKPYRAFNVIQR